MFGFGLVRSYLVILVVGWGLWFWLDKGPSPTAQVASPYGAPLPGGFTGYPAPMGAAPPVREEGIVGDLQTGVDLLKRGEAKAGFAYLWRRQSWVLAGVLTLLVSLVTPGLVRGLGRLRGRSRTRSPAPPGAD